MKDDKYTVFALNSYTTTEPSDFSSRSNKKEMTFVPQGFLLFPDEAKADTFLELCDSLNKVTKTNHYTKHGYVKVDDYAAGRVEAQQNFYISVLKNPVIENLDNATEVAVSSINESAAIDDEAETTESTNKPKM
jgi:hypothetical protein